MTNFPEQASSISGLGAPHLLHSLPPLFTPPICVCPPHLCSPSFPHRQGVPKVSWPHHFQDPHMLTPPFAQVTPLVWPPPLCPPISAPSPCFAQMGVQEGQCTHPVPSAWAT